MTEPKSDSASEAKTETRTESPARRNFLTSIASVIVAGSAAGVPLTVSAVALLDPLRRRQSEASPVMVTRLGSIPESGVPKKFTVAAERIDAWTTYHEVPVGAVYLRRIPDGVEALNAVCPHAGCFVGLAPDHSRFACPCHKSSFALDGTINDPASPSPRDMDSLEVEVRNGDEVWVRFQNFLPGRAEKTVS